MHNESFIFWYSLRGGGKDFSTLLSGKLDVSKRSSDEMSKNLRFCRYTILWRVFTYVPKDCVYMEHI